MCKKVSWETETLMGTAPPASRWERYIPRAAIPHVGLFVALMLYTAGGGLVSYLPITKKKLVALQPFT
ncbi:unnamed protein product [Pieris brassicae]|uniref:Uncharacterized protein n=1 Tax=Pieris brassicae TaxID=7116 RepID=A0A9P0TJ42_PIEBR|nr:unnamed protein product [Pieris brassicae]